MAETKIPDTFLLISIVVDLAVIYSGRVLLFKY